MEQGIIVRDDGAIETAAGTIPAELRRAAELYAVYLRGQAFHALANALRKIVPQTQFDPQLASRLEEMAYRNRPQRK